MAVKQSIKDHKLSILNDNNIQKRLWKRVCRQSCRFRSSSLLNLQSSFKWSCRIEFLLSGSLSTSSEWNSFWNLLVDRRFLVCGNSGGALSIESWFANICKIHQKGRRMMIKLRLLYPHPVSSTSPTTWVSFSPARPKRNQFRFQHIMIYTKLIIRLGFQGLPP